MKSYKYIAPIMLLIYSLPSHSEMYIWDENGSKQMRGDAPQCYIYPTKNCPIIEVYRNGRLISSNKTETDLKKRKEIAGILKANKNTNQEEAKSDVAIKNITPAAEALYGNDTHGQSQRCKDMAAEADAIMKREPRGGDSAIGAAMIANGIYNRYERQCLGVSGNQSQAKQNKNQTDQHCIFDCMNKYSYQYCQSKCSY